MSVVSSAAREIRPGEPGAKPFPHPLVLKIAATRPAFMTVTLLGCWLGFAAAHRAGVAIDGWLVAVATFFALVAHAGVNVINDYFDAHNGSDAANTGRVFPFTGGSRFIQNGVMSLEETGKYGRALFLVVIPAGLWLCTQVNLGLIAFGVAGLLIGWAYSAPPLQLMSRGLGELSVVLGWLVIVTGADYVLRGSYAWAPWLVGMPFALLVGNILFINEFPDREADALAGKATLVVRWGPEAAKWVYLLVMLLAHAWVVMAIEKGVLPQLAGLSLLTLIPGMRAARDLLRHARQPAELANAIKLSIATANLHGVLLIIGLWFGR